MPRIINNCKIIVNIIFRLDTHKEKGADFRLKNNDGKTPEDLLMENANLNKTDIDKVKCAIWVLKDKAEQDKENQGQKVAEKAWFRMEFVIFV